MKFLSFIVFTKDVRMNSKRIKIILKWLKLKIYKETQVFLEFVNFYRRFVYRYSNIAAVLTDLLKDSKKNKKLRLFL